MSFLALTNLEVSTDDEEVNAIPSLNIARLLNRGIDGMKRPMALGKPMSLGTVGESKYRTQPSIAMRILSDYISCYDIGRRPEACCLISSYQGL